MKKIAILSNINMDPLNKYLEKAGFNDLYFCGYNQCIFDLINNDSYIHKDNVDIVFIHLDGEEFLKDDFFSFNNEVSLKEKIDPLISALEKFCTACPEKAILISEMSFPPGSFLTYLDKNSEHSFSKIEREINERFTDLSLKHQNVYIFDFDKIVKTHGFNAIYDEKYWYLGRIKYSDKGFQAIADEFAQVMNCFEGRQKKVLVLDLDNVLWGGVVGEDRPEGINVSEDGVGKIYRDLQNLIKALKGLGVLLAINSKNNEEDVREVFDENSMMVLEYDDFIVRKIDWTNKVQNLKEIAEELNLGLDSFVFIDDNPVERDFVRKNIPEVIVPEFPQAIENLKIWFLEEVIYKYFARISISKEDMEKSSQYKRNLKRKSISSEMDIREYIKTLDIKLKLQVNPSDQRVRLSQLTQKTNQFNLTTKRYSESDINNFINDKNIDVYSLEYEDKFGNEGIVGEVIVKYADNTAMIDVFLLSCRVIGRFVEFEFLEKILEDIREKNIIKVKSEYIPTKKNHIARDFYGTCGLNKGKDGLFEGDVDTLIKKISSVRP